MASKEVHTIEVQIIRQVEFFFKGRKLKNGATTENIFKPNTRPAQRKHSLFWLPHESPGRSHKQRQVSKDHSMENISLAMDTPTPNSSCYNLGSRWHDVREYSLPLAVFGAVFNCMLPVLSIGGNILLLVVIMKFPQLRHIPSNILLASLAASDLLIGLFVQSFHAAMSVGVLTTDGCSTLVDIPSTVFFYFSSFLVYSSSLNIAMITIDRYICIVVSLRYISIVSETRAVQAIIFTWAISAVLPVTRVIPSFPLTAIRALQIILISSVLLVIIFCYVKIFCISQRHKRQIISQLQTVTRGPIEQDFKSAKTVFLVVGAVLFSYTPLLAIQFLFSFNLMKDHVNIFYLFAVTIFLLHSSVNPFIIFFRSRKLRRFLRKLLKMLKLRLNLTRAKKNCWS